MNTFNKWANYKLSAPQEPEEEQSRYTQFIEHIAKHHPASALTLAREILTTETVCKTRTKKENEQLDGAHLLLRLTENHPLLALPLIIHVCSYNLYARDAVETALRYCVGHYPEESAEVLQKAILHCRDVDLQGYLYFFLQKSGYDVDDNTKRVMSLREEAAQTRKQTTVESCPGLHNDGGP